MKKIFLLLITCIMLLSTDLFAQTTKYTLHTLAQGETLSMLAEKYKTTVGDIMRLNGMHADTKLTLGKKLKIPASGQTVERNGESKPVATPPVVNTKPVVKAATPTNTNASGILTHTVLPKETMYGISKKYGVTIDQIKQWNNMPDNNLEIGQVIAVSAKGVAEAAAKRKEQAETEAKTIAAVPDQTPPVVTKEIIKVDEPVKENVVQQAEEKKTVVNNVPETKERAVTNAAGDGSDNFFTKNFGESSSSKSTASANGTAMIFKTASGWSDKKYYVLMNQAPSGSIVKISAANGNIVYAKVLWKLDEMKENKGLQFRISEAAAAALNVQGDKFPLSVQYYQ